MSIGPPELLLILVIVLIVFGAGKLPQVFNSLGRGIREFREASEGRDQTTGAVPPPAGTPTAPMPPPAPPYTAPEVPPPAYTPQAPPPPQDEPKSGE